MKYTIVSRSPDACWLWDGSRDGGGYGQLFGGKQGMSQLKAHRISYQLAYGEPPAGLFVCHRCDTPACVRPSHLFLGTQAENMEDCARKKRIRRKLTQEQAAAIRAAPGTQREIALQFGVAKTLVANIKRGRIWKYVKSTLDEYDHIDDLKRAGR